MRLRLNVKSSSLRLDDGAGTCATLAMASLQTALNTYSASQQVTLSVESSSVITPTCDLLRTGAVDGFDANFLDLQVCLFLAAGRLFCYMPR